jgi:excisionase family DNA binding protein
MPEDTFTPTLTARVTEAVDRQERVAKTARFREKMARRSYSVREVAEMIGADRSSVHRWVEKGVIQSVKIGNRRFILATEVDRLLGGSAA